MVCNLLFTEDQSWGAIVAVKYALRQKGIRDCSLILYFSYLRCLIKRVHIESLHIQFMNAFRRFVH